MGGGGDLHNPTEGPQARPSKEEAVVDPCPSNGNASEETADDDLSIKLSSTTTSFCLESLKSSSSPSDKLITGS